MLLLGEPPTTKQILLTNHCYNPIQHRHHSPYKLINTILLLKMNSFNVVWRVLINGVGTETIISCFSTTVKSGYNQVLDHHGALPLGDVRYNPTIGECHYPKLNMARKLQSTAKKTAKILIFFLTQLQTPTLPLWPSISAHTPQK